MTVSILLLLAMTLSLCGCFKTEPSDSADTDQPPTGTTENENTLIHGIETVEYPSPQSVYMYDRLTKYQKIYYDALAEITAKVIETKGQETIEYPMSMFISNTDESVARELYAMNFEAQRELVNGYITAVCNDNERAVALSFNKGSGAYDCIKKYVETTEAADSILASLDHDGTEYGKALAIATWMVDNIRSPIEEENRDDDLDSIYSALIKKEALCGGYAKAYDLLCRKAGLSTIYVTGNTLFGSHAWNMIRIDDHWYHVDVTWMDDSGDFYGSFMLPDEICFANRWPDTLYYLDEETGEDLLPSADSYELYKSFYESIEDMLEHYENNVKISEQVRCAAVLPHTSKEEVIALNGSEITSHIDGQTYYIYTTEASQASYIFSFVKKLPVLAEDGDSTEDGLRQVEYAYDAVICDFDWSDQKDINDLIITASVPGYLARSDQDYAYKRFDNELAGYITALEFSTAFQVHSDFIMDETVHGKTAAGGTWSSFENRKVSVGTTKAGNGYVIYERIIEGEYEADVYVRVSDKYIISVRYRDLIENYDYMLQSINSIEIKE